MHHIGCDSKDASGTMVMFQIVGANIFCLDKKKFTLAAIIEFEPDSSYFGTRLKIFLIWPTIYNLTAWVPVDQKDQPQPVPQEVLS